jgi:hypothetical protein
VYFWGMPGGIEFMASIARSYRHGAIFLEGIGVPPNVVVPATAVNLLNPDDEVLAIAQEALGPANAAGPVAPAESVAAEATPAASAPTAATPVS